MFLTELPYEKKFNTINILNILNFYKIIEYIKYFFNETFLTKCSPKILLNRIATVSLFWDWKILQMAQMEYSVSENPCVGDKAILDFQKLTVELPADNV